MKPTNKTVIPWLVRTTLSTVLYETDVCIKLFNLLLPSLASEVGLIGRRVSLLLNYIKKEKDGIHRYMRN
jgi:hypothetical protein